MSARRARMTAAIVRQQSVGWLSDRIHEDQARIASAAVRCVVCGRWGAKSQYVVPGKSGAPLAWHCANRDNCAIRFNGLVPPSDEPMLPCATPLTVQRAQRTMLLCLNELRRRGFVDAALSEAGLLTATVEGGVPPET